MAITTQILQDGPRNTVVKVSDTAVTAGYGPTPFLLPTTYQATYIPGSTYLPPATWRIDFMEFSISDGIELTLSWDATTPVPIMPISGRGNKHFKNFGGISGYLASSSAGWTGGMDLTVGLLPYGSPAGTPTGSTFTYMLVMDLVKQGPNLS